MMQLVLFDQVGDKTFVSSTSSELKRFGYEGGTSNIPAAYLTGLLFGKKAKEAGFDEAIFDTGLQTPNHCSKEYAALKGVVHSGIEIPHNPAVFPPDERVRGEHIATFKQDPSIVDNFEAVKKGILAESEENK
jgi:large subunit ribosomal protein L18